MARNPAREEPLIAGFSPVEIRRVLIKRLGVTLREIALQENVDLSTVSTVLAGRQRSQRLELAIARRLGLSHQAVFPEHAGRRRVAAKGTRSASRSQRRASY